ncbi:hypothetical protein NQZ68_007144 [Dissostichus eleginoides]|nr:hypothetical protein NQZ68_007144 [Dissostichus eleginoides]
MSYRRLLRSEKVERKRAASKARVVKHREKVYSNPELLEEYRRKEIERLEQDIVTLCVRERERRSKCQSGHTINLQPNINTKTENIFKPQRSKCQSGHTINLQPNINTKTENICKPQRSKCRRGHTINLQPKDINTKTENIIGIHCAFYEGIQVRNLEFYRGIAWKRGSGWCWGTLKNLADRLVAYGTDIPDAEALLHNLSKQSSVKLFKCTQWREAAGPAGEYLGGGACCLGDGPPLGPDRPGPGEPCPYSPP